jgi:hypothetical protein
MLKEREPGQALIAVGARHWISGIGKIIAFQLMCVLLSINVGCELCGELDANL